MQSQSPPQDRTLELRVQRGPQAGARSPLPPLDDGRAFELHIGGAPHDGSDQRDGHHRRRHDLTLVGTSWARLRATPADDGKQIRLELLEGIASVDGRPLPAAMPVAWPMYASLQVADVTLAFGHAIEPVWDAQREGHDGASHEDDGRAFAPAGNRAAERAEGAREPIAARTAHDGTRGSGAAHSATHSATHGTDASAAADPRDAALAHAQAPALQWQRRLVITGASLLAASLLLFGLAKLSGFGGKPHNVLLIEQALATKGFTALTMQPDAAGVPRITGTLPSKADEQALDELLKRLGAQAKLDIRLPSLSEQVTAFFERSGVPGVRIENLGGGRIEAHTRSARLASTEHQDETIADARREISGLLQLTIRNELPAVTAAASSCSKALDDPGKQPTSVVWHERTPYLNTADGSKYMLGSLLPGGYLLRAIDKDKTVTFECDGRIIKRRL
jgi:hypothetical protein